MNPKVDTGQIIGVRKFPLFDSDSVFSLTQRCYSYILTLFYEIMSLLLENNELPKSNENWKRKPYKRKELNELCKITPNMPEDEIAKRVRAVTFPNAPGAYIQRGNMKFNYEISDRQ